MSRQGTNQYDDPHFFFMECHRIAMESQFIVDSLPNAETPAVERAVRQLDSIRTILLGLHDPSSTPEEIAKLLTSVQTLQSPLQVYLDNPPPPRNTNVPLLNKNRPGRPQYILDLDRAHELHQLGNTWAAISTAMGVSRQTMYTHMANHGRATARKQYSEISDNDLDEIVAEISLSHPFVGSAIVEGHLESRGVHVARLRVQDSLRRMDSMGVLVR